MKRGRFCGCGQKGAKVGKMGENNYWRDNWRDILP